MFVRHFTSETVDHFLIISYYGYTTNVFHVTSHVTPYET